MVGLIKYLHVGFCGLILFGCFNGPNTPYKEVSQSQNRLAVLLDLEFVKQCVPYHCQSYQVSLTGEQLVKTVGSNIQKNSSTKTFSKSLSKKLSKQEIIQIAQLIEQLNLQSMQTTIVQGTSECTSYSSDGDSYRLIINKGDFSQTLQIYAGCHDLASRYVRMIDWFQQQALILDRPES